MFSKRRCPYVGMRKGFSDLRWARSHCSARSSNCFGDEAGLCTKPTSLVCALADCRSGLIKTLLPCKMTLLSACGTRAARSVAILVFKSLTVAVGKRIGAEIVTRTDRFPGAASTNDLRSARTLTTTRSNLRPSFDGLKPAAFKISKASCFSILAKRRTSLTNVFCSTGWSEPIGVIARRLRFHDVLAWETAHRTY